MKGDFFPSANQQSGAKASHRKPVLSAAFRILHGDDKELREKLG